MIALAVNVQTVLMLAGGVIWLGGEIWGVCADAHGHTGQPETTSGWVWLMERRWRWTRMLVAAGLAALGIHFLLH